MLDTLPPESRMVAGDGRPSPSITELMGCDLLPFMEDDELPVKTDPYGDDRSSELIRDAVAPASHVDVAVRFS